MRKKEAQRIHFQRRADERFGLALNHVARQRIVEEIQANRARFVERQSLRLTVWDLDIEGKPMRVVYDKIRKSLVTALFRELPLSEHST